MADFKQSLRDLPISRKIVFAIMIVSGAVALVTCAAFFVSEIVGLRRNTERHLATLGEMVAANSTAALAFENAKDATEILTSMRADSSIEAAALYDARGSIFARYPEAPSVPLPGGPAASGYRSEAGALAGFQPVTLAGKVIGTLYIRYSLGALYARLWLDAGIVAIVLAVALLISYALSGILERMISRPVVALAETAQAVTERRDYSIRAPSARSHDEVGQLSDAFNNMLAELQALHEDLERRVADRTLQLEAANRELEAFSYSVSHDLRAPLRHVHGFIALLEKHCGDSMDEKGRRYTDTIGRAAKQMGRLIDDLLSFSRIGRADMLTTVIDHGSLVGRVIRETAFGHGDRKVEWVIGSLPPTPADPGLIRLVWMNLIDNALKYSGKVASPRIEIGATPAPTAAKEEVYFVRDNGVGFDMKYSDKLFGVFQRLHSPADFEGTGIGLANVQRIVHRHGGRVWAEGKPEAGATFYFSLPLPPAETLS